MIISASMALPWNLIFLVILLDLIFISVGIFMFSFFKSSAARITFGLPNGQMGDSF